MIPASTLALSLWLLAPQAGASAPAPDRLAGVKALYAAADYDAALIVLSTDDVASAPGADQYRALCLLALGRIEEQWWRVIPSPPDVHQLSSQECQLSLLKVVERPDH